MRIAATAIVIVVALFGFVTPVKTVSVSVASRDSRYILVGGQNGTWFESGQVPRLERVDLSNYSVTNLTPASGAGVVWTGGWNGSQWLIAGFGTASGPKGSNPYLYLYDGKAEIKGGSQDQYDAEDSWHGGDVFAASYNGREWLLSGMGSDVLPSYSPMQVNHLSLATFDGDNFTDLSGNLPEQMDGILYANAWNGKLWLIGGGYGDTGVLYSYDGSVFQDLTQQIRRMVLDFGSVQSLAWNGNYWLIGGINFLAKYEDNQFTDLTPQLASALNWTGTCCNSINAIAWNGREWMIGGGAPVAQFSDSRAWLASYSSNHFVSLTSTLGDVATEAFESSILTVTSIGDSWFIGGYANGHGILYSYSGSTLIPLSDLVTKFTYVNWVGAGMFPNISPPSPPPPINRPILGFSSTWALVIGPDNRMLALRFSSRAL